MVRYCHWSGLIWLRTETYGKVLSLEWIDLAEDRDSVRYCHWTGLIWLRTETA